MEGTPGQQTKDASANRPGRLPPPDRRPRRRQTCARGTRGVGRHGPPDVGESTDQTSPATSPQGGLPRATVVRRPERKPRIRASTARPEPGVSALPRPYHPPPRNLPVAGTPLQTHPSGLAPRGAKWRSPALSLPRPGSRAPMRRSSSGPCPRHAYHLRKPPNRTGGPRLGECRFAGEMARHR